MSSGSTARLALTYPVGTDPAAIPTDVQGLAGGLDGIVAPWVQSITAPVAPIAGQMWWNTVVTSSTFGLNYYDGTAWWNILSGPQYIGSSAPASALCYPGLIWVNTSFVCTQFQICTAGGGSPTWLIIVPGSNTTGQTLINTGSGIQWGTYSDATKLSVGGGTMTGLLVLSGNPVVALGAAPKQYVDAETARAEAAEALLVPLNNVNLVLKSPIETGTIVAAAPAATTTLYASTNGTVNTYTTATANNFVINLAATSGITLNTLMAIGQSVTFSMDVINGATAYYCTAINIDGTAQTVLWQGGTAPSAGHTNTTDSYVVQVMKTAASTYIVKASQTYF
jgi:hypothetical protein